MLDNSTDKNGKGFDALGYFIYNHMPNRAVMNMFIWGIPSLRSAYTAAKMPLAQPGFITSNPPLIIK